MGVNGKTKVWFSSIYCGFTLLKYLSILLKTIVSAMNNCDRREILCRECIIVSLLK